MERHVGTLLIRPIRLREPEMPFADVGGPVACVAQRFRERVFGWLQEIFTFRQEQRLVVRRGVGQILEPRWLRRPMPCGAGDAVP